MTTFLLILVGLVVLTPLLFLILIWGFVVAVAISIYLSEVFEAIYQKLK